MGRPKSKEINKVCVMCNNLFKTKDTKRGREKKTCTKSCSAKLGQKNNVVSTECSVCKVEMEGSKSAITQKLPLYCDKCTHKRYYNKCDICNNKFRTSKKDTRFCCQNCINKHLESKYTEIECYYCGNILKRPTRDVYTGKNTYCSQRCRNNQYSIDNPTRYGGTWDRRKREIYKRDKGRCLICNTKNNIEYHHFKKLATFDNPNNAHYDENVGTFCKKHHQKIEGKYESLTDFNERYSPNG